MAAPSLDATNIKDVNTISEFLAGEQVSNLAASPPVDAIVICASAVLYGADVLFRALSARSDLTDYLVLCGGAGHSTSLIYDAVACSSQHGAEVGREELQGLPEARVLEVLLHRFHGSLAQKEGLSVLVEDKSTNCLLNAVYSRRVLEDAGIVEPKSLLLIQDPTMQLRTAAAFQKVYEDVPGFEVISCPTFVPRIKSRGVVGGVEYDIGATGMDQGEFWSLKRFLSLVMGEIPRLRDDEKGYGPKGTNSIPHVDIPDEVEAAWGRLKEELELSR